MTPATDFKFSLESKKSFNWKFPRENVWLRKFLWTLMSKHICEVSRHELQRKITIPDFQWNWITVKQTYKNFFHSSLTFPAFDPHHMWITLVKWLRDFSYGTHGYFTKLSKLKGARFYLSFFMLPPFRCNWSDLLCWSAIKMTISKTWISANAVICESFLQWKFVPYVFRRY